MLGALPKCFRSSYERQVVAMLHHRPSYFVSKQVLYVTCSKLQFLTLLYDCDNLLVQFISVAKGSFLAI